MNLNENSADDKKIVFGPKKSFRGPPVRFFGHWRRFERLPLSQGCQMVYFQTKRPNLGKFCRGLAIEVVGIF
jgi:hypothetical protein